MVREGVPASRRCLEKWFPKKRIVNHAFLRDTPAHFEVATTTTKKTRKILGGGSGQFVTVGGIRLELHAPRCITDPARSRRQLYIRLETWLSRFMWEAFRAGRELEAQRLTAEVYYIRHLHKGRRISVRNRWDLAHDRFIDEFVAQHFER